MISLKKKLIQKNKHVIFESHEVSLHEVLQIPNPDGNKSDLN